MHIAARRQRGGIQRAGDEISDDYDDYEDYDDYDDDVGQSTDPRSRRRPPPGQGDAARQKKAAEVRAMHIAARRQRAGIPTSQREPLEEGEDY